MTLGFAVAAWRPSTGPFVMIAADSRLTTNAARLSDFGVKTYELGGRCAMVAAGHALPALTAAELVRPLVETHNRAASKRLGFYDTVRLAAFFLRRASEAPRLSTWAVVAGFLESGRPCLANISVSADRNRVNFFSVDEQGTKALPVGNPEAANFLLQGLAAADDEKKPVVSTGISLLWYMASHSGAFASIGGGIAIGTCRSADSCFSWPHIEICGRRFMRGVDITEYAQASWPAAERIVYDEDWCANLDRRLHQEQRPIENFTSAPMSGYDIDVLCSPEALFLTNNDPIAFDGGLPRSSTSTT